MINTKEIINILPQNIGTEFGNRSKQDKVQEIRIRAEKSLVFQLGDREFISKYVPSIQDVRVILQRISNYSIYAYDEEIRQGYITIKGGHRVGICGRCVNENGKIKTIKDIASLNIRICREIIGCSDKVMRYIVSNENILNTIIISPPKCGKTTLIRDIARNISQGFEKLNFIGKKVCVIDERGEIGACFNGIAQLHLGIRTDVLDSCPKNQGIMMAIRSMSPDVIICDEIGTYEDVESIVTALNSGINLITTIHGYGIEDLYNRAVFKEILDNHVFERAIILSNSNGAGTIEYIYDFKNKDNVWRR